MTVRITSLALMVLGLAPAWNPGIAAQEHTFQWRERLSAGQTLEVRGIVGEIRAELARGDEVEVVARKRGDEDDFHEVAVEVAEDGRTVIICAVYGSWKHGEGACHPDYDDDDRRWRRHRDRDMDVEVDYEVRVPAGIELVAAVVSGNVRARGLQSDVSGSTVDGDVRIETTGRAWANTVSGDIEVEMGDTGHDDMDFNTVSGDITLWLPADFSAEVDFSSLSGDLDTEFEMRLEGRRSRRWIGSRVEGTIGGGGRELKLNTVSGDVELRRKRG